MNRTSKTVISRPAGRYATAIAAVGAALVLRLPLTEYLGCEHAFLTFYPAVVLAAVVGGMGPGVLATVLSALAAILAVLPPTGGVWPLALGDAVGLGIFVIMGLFISLVAGLYHRTRERLASIEEDLAHRPDLAPRPGEIPAPRPAERTTDLTRPLIWLALAAGVAVTVIGAGHLIAWLSGAMAQRGLATLTMKTNAALSLTLLGAALMLLMVRRPWRWALWACRLSAGAAMLIGLLTLSQYVAGWDLGVDQLLAKEAPGAMGVAHPNRTGVPASISVVLAGAALLGLSLRGRPAVVGQALALGVLLVALFSTIGFLYGVQPLYAITNLTAIALPTALALLMLGVGLLAARPGQGLTVIVTGDDAGGRAVRWLLPACLALPLLVGFLRLLGERRGFYGPAMGTALTVLTYIVLFSWLVIANALSLRRREAAQRADQQALKHSREDLARAQAVGRIGWWRLDTRHDILTWSDETYRIFATPQGTPMTYEKFLDCVHPDDRPYVDTRWTAAVAGEPYDIEHRIQAGGQVRWVREKAYLEFDPAGHLQGGFGIVQDITDRKRMEQELRQARDELEQRVAERTGELEQRAAQLSRLTSELTLAEQRERQRLAALLHDHLQQLLAGAKMGLELLWRRVEQRQRQAVEQVRDLLDESIKASRELTAELAPPILREAGLPAGLEWLGRWMGDKHGLEVQVHVGPDTQVDREDVRVLLFQSVRELLFNVVKHAKVTRARVELARQDERHIRVVVSDEGVGLDLGAGQALPPSGDMLTGGFGLFSIRERLHLLGGRMDIRTGPHQGTRITLLAPCGRSKGLPAGAAKAHRTAELAVAAPPPGAVRVLLADDHTVMREGLCQLIQAEQDLVVVGQAANGQEAIEQARQLRPDVILMDFSMPGIDGVQATRVIHAERPEIRVIGLSMYEESDRAAAMLAAGAIAYLTKSGSPALLLSAIRQSIAQQA